ncbi:hypothetical protein E2562_030273 [Oryza meyeriana var. granulata]|uniref:Uncharacterized protein n=1 Tax=Oryza meyeriana var. granulata TaxID=110450 RepID=A0A6G1D8C6_9ORYZ|nr:hypothetical protein E2562_030273 [Oryza meyeriana var. granulata]
MEARSAAGRWAASTTMTQGTGVEKMGTASRLGLRAHRRQTRATTGDEMTRTTATRLRGRRVASDRQDDD